MIVNTERDHLLRETGSKALINNDINLYRQRQVAKQRDSRIKKLETDVESLTGELREIRELIASIVQRN